MFWELFSGKSVKKWTSEETMVRVGRMLWRVAVRLRMGRRSRASRKVLMTLVVMVDSWPSTSLKLGVAIPISHPSVCSQEQSRL